MRASVVLGLLLGAGVARADPELRIELAAGLELRAHLKNATGAPIRYFVSHKLQPIELEITDAAGKRVAAVDARADPAFDAAVAPIEGELAAGDEMAMQGAPFTLAAKELASSYGFFWRPFAYPPFPPGRYKFQATWRSTRGFNATLRSNVIEVSLPAPEDGWCEPIPDDGISLPPSAYHEPMDTGCMVTAPLTAATARGLARHLPGEKVNLPGPNTQAHLESLPRAGRIQRLYLGPGELTTLAPLARLPELEELVLDSAHLRLLATAGPLPRLKRLILDGCPPDYDGVKGLRALEELEILRSKGGCAGVTRSLEGLRGAPRLRRLELSDPDREAPPGGAPLSIEALGTLSSLEDLDLAGLRVGDARALAKLTRLRRLAVVGLMDLSPLAGLKRLETLELAPSPESEAVALDLTPLAGLPALRSVSLATQRVVSLAPLARARRLEKLQLRDLCHDGVEAVKARRPRLEIHSMTKQPPCPP